METKKLTGTLTAHYGGYDWGFGCNKITITFDDVIDVVDLSTFSVSETKQVLEFTPPDFPVSVQTLPREIVAAYLVDKDGKFTSKPSNIVVIRLHCSPTEGSPILFSLTTMFNTYSDPYTIQVQLAKPVTSGGETVETIEVDETIKKITTDADNFTKASYQTSEGLTYQYAYQINHSDTLVVWLHGLGEGGTVDTDPNITLMGNKVIALGSQDFQKIVPSSILAVQCPTFWMDKDGKGVSLFSEESTFDGTSYYTTSLLEIIDYFKKECKAKKVVLAGCSNGGFMTMLLGLRDPKAYAAIVPICEALPDALISDAEIEEAKDLPMFFIYSKDDPIVNPQMHEIPTIERLRKAGASNLRVSTSESVIDTSGKYQNPDGTPYTYSGHWSWIYFFNNEAKDDETDESAWSWLAKAIK